MRSGASMEYGTGLLILERSDFPLSADVVISAARGDHQATMIHSWSGEEWFIVRFPVHGDWAYTEDELRRRIRSENQIVANIAHASK